MTEDNKIFRPSVKHDNKVQANIRAWVQALVSGEYAQGRSKLKSGYGYCCLGVACQVANPDGWDDYGHLLGSANKGGKHYKDGDGNAYLSLTGARKFGLTNQGQTILAQMNDSGTSFLKVAAYILEQFAEAIR